MDHAMKIKNISPNHVLHTDLIGRHIAPFITELRNLGYADSTLSLKCCALQRFIEWRCCSKFRSSTPDESELTSFVARSPRSQHERRRTETTALRSFLAFLRRQGIIEPIVIQNPDTPGFALQQSYADFLRDEKGLAERSLKVYLPVVQDLLEYFNKGKRSGPLLQRLNTTVVRAYLLRYARDHSSESVRLRAVSLRSFLRFLHARDEIDRDLTVAIPKVGKWTQPDVPKKLTTEEVARILDEPDRTSPIGRRDYAVLLLLARLGLRSSEILALELGDVRWRRGEIIVRGKGRRLDVLPLPRDVGAAIADYLRLDRGNRSDRRVFLRAEAPRVPLTGPASIGHIVRYAMARAGVERPMQIAAHLFRHTLASRMLNQGANLWEIAETLRHRSTTTTEIYAKIDMRRLREVVRPWPSQGGAR